MNLSASTGASLIDPAEHERTIAALRAPKRERPVIAVAASNAATEVTDLLSSFGVLARAAVAEVRVVAAEPASLRLDALSLAPVRLYPATLWIEPQSTMRAFDEHYRDGADYVVVPAIEPQDDPAVARWIEVQHRQGATIVSVCNGSLTIAAAGLIDGRRATAHWSGIPRLLRAHPSMHWVRDRRYVVDDRVMTSTGITAAIPAMVTLVEAIAGRDKAEQLAADLGLEHWDEQHCTSAFELNWKRRRTFMRNLVSVWRHDSVAVPVDEGADEVALGLTIDAYARTNMTRVVTVGGNGEAVRSRHGLMMRPETGRLAAKVDLMLPAPTRDRPALMIERELANIASRYDQATADFVALTMEYPWSTAITRGPD
jgi:putative intracellular protease/amidase